MLKAGAYSCDVDHRLRDHVDGRSNTTHDQIAANVRANIKRHLPQAQPYPAQPDVKVALLCGGPSLEGFKKEIKARRRRGWKLATVNGSHNWALDNGLEPSCQIMLDARAWNARFLDRPIDACRYLIASQCDPAAFDAVEGRDVTIWHAVGKVEKPILDRHYRGRYVHVQGGTTVGSRALWLLYMFGFRKIAIYGMDGCLKKGAHHAYQQPENDQEQIYKARVGRRTFYCHPWMAVQADELTQLLPMVPDDLALEFRGDNFISYMIRYTAEHGRGPKIRLT